ncbi:MAG: hypothetical protein GXY58_05575 [Planctomycetaceae bacterium]|nr:hypothetical protein [Planctomycetaceae bacterium]
MGVLGWISRLFSARLDKTQLASRMVAESRTLVHQRVAPRAGSCASMVEAQGYVRARARSVVRSRLAEATARCGRLSAEQQREILEQALSLMADQLARPLVRRPAAAAAAVRRHAA